MKTIFILFVLLIYINCRSQTYTSFFTGNSTDIVSSPEGGICMMGGATENDEAMKWFLTRAKGGDILVLRASGSNGYNSYLYSELGVKVNSVETIVCKSPAASKESYILNKINKAEAIWFAGGNQWNYVNYWRGSPIDSAINQAIKNRNIVIGGTSAGMAILGKYYFSAMNGTVNSATTLADPFHPNITVDSSKFIVNKFLEKTITDTHFDNPDRKGRLVTFLARILNDYKVYANAIACDEFTSVCIDQQGKARVFGKYPSNDDNAYFIQLNCELSDLNPEVCKSGNPLTWNKDGKAIKVYQVKGQDNGENYFDLKDWKNGKGGKWLDWYAINGIFTEKDATPLNCTSVANNEVMNQEIEIFPNPITDYLIIKTGSSIKQTLGKIFIFNVQGKRFNVPFEYDKDSIIVDLKDLNSGIYFFMIMYDEKNIFGKTIIKQ